MPALGVDVAKDFDFPSNLLLPLLLPVVLLLIMLLMKISLMSISAAEALLSKGVVELPLTLPLPLLLVRAGAGSVVALLVLAVTFTLADGLLGVLMVVTLVAIPLLALILFIVAGSDDGGVGGPLYPDTNVALLKGELLLVRAFKVLELLLPLLGFCSGMLSVSLSPPC